MSARKTMLAILEANDGRMDITELSRKMIKSGTLGFGVEILHVVHALRRENRVVYDRETEVVTLVSAEHLDKFSKEQLINIIRVLRFHINKGSA